MTNNYTGKIRHILGILLTVSVIVAGICLMAACIRIYQTGDQSFSRESVAAAFSKIAVPVYLCLALAAVAFLADLLLPRNKEKLTSFKNDAMTLRRLHAKTDLDLCSRDLRDAVSAQQRSRKRLHCITGLLLIVGSVIFLCYALNGENFHKSKINTSMIRAMWVLIPCLTPAFISAIFAAYRNRASIRKEIELLKQAGSDATRQPEPSPVPRKDHSKLLRCALAVIAVGFLVFGFCAGGTADVLTKAINICTECVGLG